MESPASRKDVFCHSSNKIYFLGLSDYSATFETLLPPHCLQALYLDIRHNSRALHIVLLLLHCAVSSLNKYYHQSEILRHLKIL